MKWSQSVVSDSLWPHGLWPTRLLSPWDFPGNSSGVDCRFLPQGIFQTQGSNPGLPHCRQMLNHLSHHRSESSHHRSESNHQKSATLSEPTHVSIQTYCILFSPNKFFTCFTTFHLYVEIHFYTACHCKLVPGGLVARIQRFPWHCLTSNSGWKLKACFKLLQAEAIPDHCHFLT